MKPGKDKEVLDYWRGTKRPAGGRKADVIRTGDRTYCFIGAWDSMEAIVAARPEMVENLDRVRALLEDLGDDIGVTDAVSGDVVMSID